MKFEKVFHRGRAHYLRGHKIRSKLYNVFCRLFFHCDIPVATQIAQTAYFCHNAFGVVINHNTKILGGGNSERSIDW